MFRHGMILLVLAATTSWPTLSRAATTCQPTPQGNLCVSEVNFSRFAQTAFMTQANSQWCWAASLSMVYSYYQHPISQQRIVSEVYGGLQNVPASGYTISSKLNGCFTDDSGRTFQSQLVAGYDADAGLLNINNQQIISALDSEQPLIIGTRSHAMVLTAIQYFQTIQGPNVVAAGVFDPWPGEGARPLQMDELYPVHLGGSMRFLALPRFGDTCTTLPSDPEDTEEPVALCRISRSAGGSALPLLITILGLSLLRRRR